MLGQTFTVLAVRAGGVSIHAPLMGTKVIFVAVFGTILTGSLLSPHRLGGCRTHGNRRFPSRKIR